MVFRKKGALLPLEQRILEAAIAHGAEGVYGFGLAQELAIDKGDTSLVSHGTLYKALDRMRRAGLLEAVWEDPELAEAAGRPRRRTYRVTALGVREIQAVAAAERLLPGGAEA